MTKFYTALLSAFGILAIAQPASAVVVVGGTSTINSADLSMTRRVTRNAIASTWSSTKSFPGSSAQSPTYYELLNATFTANAVQAIYYEITYTKAGSDSANPFSVAYLNAFSASDLTTNYLGDAGRSPTTNQESLSYQIVVGAGQSLILNFQGVGSGPVDYSYSVSAFSDANRGENFLPMAGAVPEPATWAMMTLGFGAMGFAMRRKKATSRIRFA